MNTTINGYMPNGDVAFKIDGISSIAFSNDDFKWKDVDVTSAIEKYVTLDSLKTYDKKIKEYISEVIENNKREEIDNKTFMVMFKGE